MQIHLLDCKSSVPLRRGLGGNKLNLCMLVLSQLSDTYWSASVIYRLFARAQAIIDKSNTSASTEAEKPTISADHMESHSNGRDIETETQRQHQHEDQQSQQQQDVIEDSIRPLSDSNATMNEHGPPFWMNEPLSFNNVDQLLSPGFSVSDNVFLSLFAGYDNGIARAPEEFANPSYQLN
jgi:hypothetical protein